MIRIYIFSQFGEIIYTSSHEKFVGLMEFADKYNSSMVYKGYIDVDGGTLSHGGLNISAA